MNVLVKLGVVAFIWTSYCDVATAEQAVSFNGQVLTSGLSIKKDKPYGEFQPSQFSDQKQVVLVSWNSEEGKKRLFRSKYTNDFFQLANHYQPQANPLYCGIASSVIVLNTIRATSGKIPPQMQLSIKKPKVLGGEVIPYKLYSQATLLNESTDKVKSRKIIQLKNISDSGKDKAEQFDPGLKLADLKGVLESYELEVQDYPAELEVSSGVIKFRDTLKRVLAEQQQFILINYKSNLVGQSSSGHISPVGAYDAKSDSVLVLDVAGYQNPWIWIPVKDLYASMHTKDGERYRGYLVVQEGKKSG